jgi:nicotinate-nucleotide pyrophosphorylase (carboxylating)
MMVWHALTEATRRRLTEGGVDPDAVAALVRAAVAEDLAGGFDITSVATVPPQHRCHATFTSRADGVVAGLAVAVAVLEAVCGPTMDQVTYLATDGDRVRSGQSLLRVSAPTRSLLTAERSALNLLGHLSGVATLTRRWADELEGTTAVVRDTRKTTPGVRALEKMAVRCGGGRNHRMALSDAALVKDNHVAAAGGVAAAFARVRALAADVEVEIEVDDLDGLAEAIDAGADLVLLDNFSLDDMVTAVAMRTTRAPHLRLEASGGLTLGDARAVGATGVDYIAVGELTHSARVLDIGLDIDIAETLG